MTTAIFATPQVTPVKAQASRAGAAITVQDRMSWAFQDMLSQTIEQRLEKMERKNFVRPRPSRPATEVRGQIDGATQASRARATEVRGQIDGATQASRARATEVRGQIDGATQAGRAVATEVRGQIDGATQARRPVTEVRGQIDGATQARRAVATEVRGHLDGAMQGVKGYVGKGLAVGFRGELIDHEENLMGKNSPIRPRVPGKALTPEGIALMPSKDLEPVFGRTPFKGEAGLHLAPVQPGLGTVGEESPDVRSIWKDFMKRWIEGKKDEEERKADEEALGEALDTEPVWDAFRAGLSE